VNILDYETAGGKNLILEYIDDLPTSEKAAGYRIRDKIEAEGETALKYLTTRQLRGKLWEIKFSANRIMYVIKDSENIYFLHACKKQKGKAEKMDLDKAIRRAKEAGLKVD
jgi:phage-related protein